MILLELIIYFYLVNQVVVYLNKRFELYQEYESIFGFLFTAHKLQSLDDATLKSCCGHFETTLKHNEQSDTDGNELFVELRLLKRYVAGRKIRLIDVLRFLKSLNIVFPIQLVHIEF